jgi:uncharacterized alpha-E superfamily protein
VREQISSEMWLQINRLYLDVKQAKQSKEWWDEPHNFYSGVKLGIHLFQGISDSTMVHNQGWHFIQIGRYLERIISLTNLLGSFINQPQHQNNGNDTADYFSMLALLKSATGFEAYCKVYNPELNLNSILEFLLYNDQFPHSAHFCIDEVLRSLHALGDTLMMHKNNRPQRLAGRLQSSLSYTDLDEVLESSLADYLNQIRAQATSIHEALLSTFITYPIEPMLT